MNYIFLNHVSKCQKIPLFPIKTSNTQDRPSHISYISAFFFISPMLYVSFSGRMNIIHSIPIIINQSSMNYPQLTLVPTRRIARHISENQYLKSKQLSHIDRHHRLSEPRGKINLIKINKNKLPNDFFQKKENRRVSEQKIYFHEQFTEPILYSKKIESERFIYSPQKTSFFGMLEQKKSENLMKANQPISFLNRKFQTRQETKRDLFGIESNRKVTNTSKPSKRNILELFPPTYDEKMSEIINETSKVHLTRTTPKQLTPIQRQSFLFIDPEKRIDLRQDFNLNSQRKQKDSLTKITNVSMSLQNDGGQMTITFYNAKSNSLPPINRQNI